MLDNVSSATIRLPLAAYAAGMSPRALRGLCDDDKIPFDAGSDRERHSFRLLSVVEVLRLAVMRPLMRYGFTAAEAWEIVRVNVDPLYDSMIAISTPGASAFHVAIPLAMLASRLQGARLMASRESSGIVVHVEPSPGRAPTPTFEHHVTVDLGAVADGVRARLRARADDAP